MYQERVDRLREGQVLAKSVSDEAGRVLLQRGTALKPAYIAALERRGYTAVYLTDGVTDDVPPHEPLSEEVRNAVSGTVSRFFATVTSAGFGKHGDAADQPKSVDQAIHQLGPGAIELDETDIADLNSGVEAMMAELANGDVLMSLDSLKEHSTYTFQHSVDVAVVGILLARRAKLPEPEVRELGIGCLVHDIGKTYIDHAILDKPAKLTREEFEEVKKHPLMGFELLRRTPMASILPAHVAYQHHERQDGTGYPRGLVGDNGLERPDRLRLDPTRMLLIAEIAAVADVYSAVVSDRPYRPGMQPDEVRRLLEGARGNHLNRFITNLLLPCLPPYPVGRWIEIAGGCYTGYRGVVTAVPEDDIDQPVVRLVLDDRGEQLANPIELDVRATPTPLVCLASSENPFHRGAEATTGQLQHAAL